MNSSERENVMQTTEEARFVKRTMHMHLDVAGAIKWPLRKLGKMLKAENGRFVDGRTARDWLRDQLAQGVRCLPIGEPCEGFDPAKGCPGHEVE